MIRLSEIQHGDTVLLRDDGTGTTLRASVELGGKDNNSLLFVEAFGTMIIVAARNRRNGAWGKTPGVTVLEHQPALSLEGDGPSW